jgi:hypothetical protein
MKRSLITTLIIGVAVALIVIALHATKVIAGFEAVAAQLVTDYAGATRVVGEKWQYVLVLLVALGVAWLTLTNVPRWRAWLLIALLLVELFGLAWVCSLSTAYFFSPRHRSWRSYLQSSSQKGGRFFYAGTAHI